MSASETTDDSPKKRKIGINGEHQEGQADVKILKLEGTCNGSETPQSPQTQQTGSSTASSSQASSSNTQSSNGGTCNGSETSRSPLTQQTGSSTASSSQASSSNTQSSNGGSLDHSEEVSGSSNSSLPLLPTVQIVSAYSPQETGKILQLQRGSVFSEMMKRFSSYPPPMNITYNGEKYNLTRAFDEFWSEFYDIPGFTKGYNSKIPNDENLTDIQLLVIAKILRRGWEDERYFPKKIAQPFLEACVFNREKNKDVMISKKIVIKFLEPTHEIIQIIEDDTKFKIDQEMFDVCKKLNPDLEKSCIGAEKEATCICVVTDYMLKTRASRQIWTDELCGLLDLEMFRFLMSPEITLENVLEEDMRDYITNEIYTPPHKLWHTFFYGLNTDIIDYYIRMLSKIESECYYCKCVVVAKEFLSCPKMLSSFQVDRHDCILRKVDKELNIAIERKKGNFTNGNDWKRIIMYGNKWNGWPSDLGDLPPYRHPHIVVYSLSPKKEVYIIELTISWEYWITWQIKNKINDYQNLKTTLEKIGFKVEMYALVMGSRGVVTPDFYNFCSDFLGMTHSNISRIMEKISKTILTMPYNDFMYNTAESRIYQVT